MTNPSLRASRRTLATLGVFSLTAAGGVLATSGATTASASTATGQYSCKVSDLGLKFNTPWNVSLTTSLPAQVAPGARIAAPTIKAHIVTGSDSADLLRKQVIISGASIASYTVGGAARSVNLSVTGLPYTVPAKGGITTNASGTGKAETAPTKPTTLNVVTGAFTAKLTMKSGFVANIACTPVKKGGVTIGSVKVVAPKAKAPAQPVKKAPAKPVKKTAAPVKKK